MPKVAMPIALRSTVLVVFLAAVAACGSSDPVKDSAATVAPAVVLPPFQQELPSWKAEVTLPGVWRYGYRIVDRPDTTLGAHHAIEFHYVADTAAKVPPRLLLIIRAFKKPAWDKIAASQKGVSQKLAEHGGEVYAYSIVTSNPYPSNTLSAVRVDQMMLELIAETSPFKLSFK